MFVLIKSFETSRNICKFLFFIEKKWKSAIRLLAKTGTNADFLERELHTSNDMHTHRCITYVHNAGVDNASITMDVRIQ